MSKIVVPGQYIVPAYKLKPNSDKQIERYVPGKGTIISQIEAEGKQIPVVVATILGKVLIKEIEKEEKDDVKTFVVVVVPKSNSYIDYEAEFNSKALEAASISINLPKENDIVLVKITKITQKQVNCEILSVEGFGNVLADGGVGANGETAHASLPSGGGSQNLSSHQTIASSQSTALGAQTDDIGENFKGIIRSQDIRSTDRDKVKVIESYKPGDIVRAMIISLGDGSNYYLSTARNDLGVIFAKSENGSGNLMYPVDWQNMIDVQSGLVEKRKCANPFA
ncbi:5 exonuclease subunit ski4 [Scheffersomyces xylosifermentans]|uniref:5 exonuclease subunit ski4 n=1 Tax=Scheffersomyces xylosifermentans TaxID=1304137 RepID=UPI00315D1865